MKKQWKWVIGIAVFCVFAPILSFVTYIGIRSHAVDGGAAVAEKFLGDLRSHNYAEAHALMAPPEQAAASEAKLAAAQAQFEKKQGDWIAPAQKNEYHPNDALDHITYFYTVAFKNEDSNPYIMVRVVRTNEGWRVIEYHYAYSPA